MNRLRYLDRRQLMSFEERGWKGMCVEAHAGYIELLKKNRPNSIVCHCAAGEADEDAIFYANARGSLSSLDKTSEARWQRDYAPYFSGFEEQQVKKVRLSTLLDTYQISEIDILSLDIEGYEVEAMKGLDLSRHRPKVMVIESDSPQHEAQLDKLILPHGYEKSMKLFGNLFYVRDKELGKKLVGKKQVVQLIHTQHPLDSGGDKPSTVTIDTTLATESLTVFDKLKSKVASVFQKQPPTTRQSQFMDVGFHGDEYLLSLVEHLASKSKVFVETGSNVGSTLAYVAKSYPQLRCLSCEPDQSAFEQASANTGKYSQRCIVQRYVTAIHRAPFQTRAGDIFGTMFFLAGCARLRFRMAVEKGTGIHHRTLQFRLHPDRRLQGSRTRSFRLRPVSGASLFI